MNRRCKFGVLSLLFCALSSLAIAQEDESAWSLLLDSVTVKGSRYRLPVRSDVSGVTVWDMGSMSMLPQILSNADPLHYAQMLPGIQTNNEYRGGINMEGCDNQHNTVSVNGVTIYNVNHLLGFFSAFNTSHFNSMSIAKGMVNAGSPNRLGGQLDMQVTTETSDTVGGILSVGLISSQGTLTLPLNKRTTLFLSLRDSYINLLYGRWLKADDQEIKYSFYDANVSLVHRYDDKNTFLFDFYSGSDDVRFSEDYYYADMMAKWGNTMGAAHWIYEKGNVSAKTTAYVTSYRNKFSLDMQDLSFKMPSNIIDVGLKNDVTWNAWNAGFETIWHTIEPQSVEHQGDYNVASVPAIRNNSVETSLYGNYKWPLARNLSLTGGLRGSLFTQKQSSACVALDPSVRVLYANENMHLAASYALRHQFLFQTGFSDIGLPTEFWMQTDDDYPPQYAHEFSIEGSSFLLRRKYKVSVDVFYRQLHHQLAYKGSVLDYINTVYDIHGSLMKGRGENYGFSMTLNKCTGKLTGWVSYTYTHARRSFDEAGRRKLSPANHERPHEVNVVATYALNRHWSFGGTFIGATGTPFTAAQSLYLLNNNIIIKYGEYNAARFHPYMRMDVSANYKWYNKKKHEQGVNLSLYNVGNKKNELFYYLKSNEEGSFVYRPVTFIMYMLPSLSYYYKF